MDDGDARVTDTPEDRQDTEVDTYEGMQAEVDRHFGGSWEQFLKALQNPAEVMHFVLTKHCGTDAAKFEAWAKEKELPAGWVPRFYMTLTPDGQLKS
ncbi:MAG: hypothetical protein KBB21_10005 [Nannocystaceae bacterium]|nr:hypothetical protein [Deltaproteobacteria bacterium]MBK8716832.1 hypothetical protein [Deltaproteobacteria bacterium]MBP7286939.1 hypothetical protein [Nannocystaceae bacterium]